jgi:uroporphyrinogen-III synthase
MTTVIVTRPKPVVEKTAAVYREAGFEVFKAPCFDIQTSSTVQAEWLTAHADSWLVLSVHALKHALKIVPKLQPEKTTRVIAVGPAVAKAWKKQFGQDIEFHPLMNSEGVIELLKKYQPKSIKILTTGDGRDLIRSHCMSQQISYSQINTYQRIPLPLDSEALFELYDNNQPVILTATSSGILQQFMANLSIELSDKIKAQPLVVGAKRIASIAKELGFKTVHTADNPGDVAMSECVEKIFQSNEVR